MAAESLPFSLHDPHNHAQAIIDIGSNSVRMVVYHAPSRVPVPLFNEKYYCSLGKGLASTGKLNKEGKTLAHQAVARFLVMAKRLKVADIIVLATAAIRDAEDGPEWVNALQDEFDVVIDTISGEREAELAAKGVLASMYQPVGICADLGGGSMELAFIEQDHIEKQCSFELGTLRLLDESKGDKEKLAQLIESQLGTVDWLSQTNTDAMYAIGGSFRAIAKMQMRRQDYSLPILHEFRLDKRSIDDTVTLFQSMRVDDIALLPGVPAKRATTMYPAALMLQHLMDTSDCKEVVFSVTGIREGFLFDRLNKTQQQHDPLPASARDLASLAGRKGTYADELMEWMNPLFPDEPEERKRLRYALCIVSELAWTIDPNFRAEWAYFRVMQSAVKGLTHRERIMLAMALYHRYQNRWKLNRRETDLLEMSDKLWAQCVGIAANLAFNLSGGKHGNLYHARLRVDDLDVRLDLDEEAKPLRTETVEKKLDGLGVAFRALSNLDM